MLAAGTAALLSGVALATPSSGLNPAQSDYVENCGGCHGIQGRSFPAHVPRLQGRIGYFLCTPEARAYLLRLPNVALSSLDDERLAATMNFVVFDLGRTGKDWGAPPFTADEVARGRKHPLSTAPLIATRAAIVRQIVKRCGVPAGAMRF